MPSSMKQRALGMHALKLYILPSKHATCTCIQDGMLCARGNSLHITHSQPGDMCHPHVHELRMC